MTSYWVSTFGLGREWKPIPIDQLSNKPFNTIFSFKTRQSIHTMMYLSFNISHRAHILYSSPSKRMTKESQMQTCSSYKTKSSFWTKVMLGKNNCCPETIKPTYEKRMRLSSSIHLTVNHYLWSIQYILVFYMILIGNNKKIVWETNLSF